MFPRSLAGDVAFGATALSVNSGAAPGGAFRRDAMHQAHLEQRLLAALSRSGNFQLFLGIRKGRKRRQETRAGPRIGELPELVGRDLAGVV
jgi:hypothetical protein